ncbi:mechanosensitive ion channel family protein [Acidipila sp. EB88]|nr:mechanosensitive ion channel family protein [Acidipila sp. EB88]
MALHAIIFRLLGRFRHKEVEASPLLRIVTQRIRRPALWVTLLAVMQAVLPLFPIEDPLLGTLRTVLWVIFFLVIGWVMVSGVYLFEEVFLLRYDVGVADNLKARRVRTQLQLLRRMAIILLLVIDVGLILSLFQNSRLWHYGAGLLASAGLASLVLATAAKSTASNLLAGLQIALTEPIRLDDVVIVEGEWGKIEEITTTYVVVAIWDYRRLVVPLTYFIEKPFQNWTREHADLMGTAFLYVDYSVPVDALREEFFRVLEEQPLWDRKIKALQVTNLSEQTMEIRCLLSSRNASDQFDLRCIVREAMIGFIQREFPEAFPRTRFSAVGGKMPALPGESARGG